MGSFENNAASGEDRLSFKILVDADACPVKGIITRVAKRFKIPVVMFADTSHMIDDGCSEVVTVDRAADSVDIALANRVRRGDVVVTQDFGLAALVLPKGARVLNQNGMSYTDANIDRLLFERHLAQKVRRSGGRTAGPFKRTKKDDERFEALFEKLLSEPDNKAAKKE